MSAQGWTSPLTRRVVKEGLGTSLPPSGVLPPRCSSLCCLIPARGSLTSGASGQLLPPGLPRPHNDPGTDWLPSNRPPLDTPLTQSMDPQFKPPHNWIFCPPLIRRIISHFSAWFLPIFLTITAISTVLFICFMICGGFTPNSPSGSMADSPLFWLSFYIPSQTMFFSVSHLFFLLAPLFLLIFKPFLSFPPSDSYFFSSIVRSFFSHVVLGILLLLIFHAAIKEPIDLFYGQKGAIC